MNAVNTDGATPLHDAVKRGELTVVEELLSVGAHVDVKAMSGSVILHYLYVTMLKMYIH